MKRVVSLLMVLCLFAGVLAGCQTDAPKETVIVPVDDAYRNYYEVFVYSYADSNGDRIGDFNGLADKLQYIYDMGFNGIWLMPIMPSPSYHKYDVTDYYAVDRQYGSMEDFRALVEKAHNMGIKIIIDLPINHTSNIHPWFTSAAKGPDSEYRDYYNWTSEITGGYSPVNGWYYESRFVSTMPDLNLDNPAVRAEIKNIMTFWLQDVGVDGFRLDAVTSYYTGDEIKNVQMLTWIGDTARSIKEDVYIVGEAWTDLVTIGRYSEAKVESFFTFSVAQADGSIAKLLGNAAKTPGKTYGTVTQNVESTLAEHSIPAPFLGNHDTARPANFLGRSQVEKLKMAAGLLAMLPGNPFVYYGEEIGMLGKGDDPNKRIAMLWTAEGPKTANPPGTTEATYALPSVEEQLADEASLLNYYKAAMWLRHANPEIARGESEVLPCDNDDVCIIRRTWNESSVLIVVNASKNPHSLQMEGKLTGSLSATGEAITLEDGTLNLPYYSIAILEAE